MITPFLVPTQLLLNVERDDASSVEQSVRIYKPRLHF